MTKTIATFSIEYQQFLDIDGKPTQALPAFAENTELLTALYREMVLVRIFDNKAIALQRTGKLGTFAATTGQEAISVALGSVMKENDVLCPAYREYGAQLQRGVKMSELLAFWGGHENGNNFQGNREDFPIAVPIGTQCLHAAGVATAFKLRDEKRVAVSVCGDGATSQGDFYEAVNLAGDWNLPLVFVVNNNQWAISVPRNVQTGAKTLAQKAIAGGFTGIQVDGNDIIALYYEYEKAFERARAGQGPTLIEAVTYRLCDHTTADDASRYRPKEEVEEAWKKEPIARLKNYLSNLKVWSDQQEEKLIAECTQKVEEAVKEYLAIPMPQITDMFDYLYAKLPAVLEIQREQAIHDSQEGAVHG